MKINNLLIKALYKQFRLIDLSEVESRFYAIENYSLFNKVKRPSLRVYLWAFHSDFSKKEKRKVIRFFFEDYEEKSLIFKMQDLNISQPKIKKYLNKYYRKIFRKFKKEKNIINETLDDMNYLKIYGSKVNEEIDRRLGLSKPKNY